MTIPDDPSEDATDLDDDALFEAYLDGGTKVGAPDANVAHEMPDWPPPKTRNTGFAIDAETLAWFEANHTDWQREVGFVLRAWVAANRRMRDPKIADETLRPKAGDVGTDGAAIGCPIR